MDVPSFMFTPSIWLGEGKITFASSSDSVRFYTKWVIVRETENILKAVQRVEIQDIQEQSLNAFTFRKTDETSFTVTLENDLIGKAEGPGKRSESMTEWRFSSSDFEGFEIYRRLENGDYCFHAEYGSQPDFRTIVDGTIWCSAAE